jgi:hypothetical protein
VRPRFPFFSLVAALALGTVSVGCARSHELGSADAAVEAPPDAFVRPPDAFVPPDRWMPPFTIAEHAASTPVPDLGGPRMTHPQLVVITYADDENRATLEAHARWLVTSSWLTTVGAEYGIGTGSILANVERTDAAPNFITQDELEALLVAGIADHSLPSAPDGTLDEVLYLAYFPSHTTVTDESFGESCVAYGGFHFEVENGGRPFAYAVIPSCGSSMPELTSVENEEQTVAHEVLEAASDRLPDTNPAFRFTDSGFTFSPWLFVGGELADLCELAGGESAIVRDGSFVAVRIWSNAAAIRNDRDPCIPADPTVPYFSVAITPDRAVEVGAGSSTTFDLAGWSTAPVPDFDVQAFASAGGPGTFMADVFVVRPSMNNGDHATLTVSVPPGTPSNSYAIVYVAATARGSSDYRYSPVVVYVP